jgi:hypothetical protein
MTLQGALTHTINLGSDIHGNIARLDNVIENFGGKRLECEMQLEDAHGQMKKSQDESTRPFLQEQEYREKSKRLKEVNSLLNMDEKDSAVLDTAPDESEVEVPTRKTEGRER